MIIFELACVCGYTFEGWFQDRSDFENQQTASFLVCPQCSSRDIRKILSPIRFQSSSSAEDSPAAKPSTSKVFPKEAEKALKTLQKFVEENFEDVGTELATESLKIHYGVAEARNIRGVATDLEEKELKEEGITILKIPFPAKGNDVN